MFTPMNEHLLSVIIIVLVHKLHSLGIGKLPDPILRAWYYAIAEAENRVWPRETSPTYNIRAHTNKAVYQQSQLCRVKVSWESRLVLVMELAS